jgi:signal transduction histidine kinase
VNLSLRARLLIVTAILLVLTLGATAALFSRLATRRFEQYVAHEVAAGAQVQAERLARDIGRDPKHARETLESFARASSRPTFWIRPDGAVEVAPRGFAGRATATSTGIRIEQRGSNGAAAVLEMRGGVAILDSTGRAIGRALVGPPEAERDIATVVRRRVAIPGGDRVVVGGGALPPERRVLSGLNRSIALAAAACGLLGIGLAWALSRRILGPVESLTAAARRMERGDLAARVPESGARDEIGALALAFNAMASRIERTERLRRDLVSDVAHELRTPLTHLRCQLEAIQDGLATAGTESVVALHEDVLALQRLVDDLQELALADAGQLRLDLEAVLPRAALERAAAAAEAAAMRAGVTVTVRVEGEPPAARADARRLAQALGNLVANAIAHTPSGGRVELAAAERDGAIEIAVSDTGAGIAPEQLPHVFERFWRADPSRDRATGGAGLGLAIVQQLVRAMGGEARAASEPGRGSSFSFTLPRA